MRNLLTVAFVLVASSSVLNAAVVKNGYRIDSYVDNTKAVTRIFNGSIMTMVCSGKLVGETVDGEIVVQEVKKIIVGGDKVVKVTLNSDLVMVEADSELSCYR